MPNCLAYTEEEDTYLCSECKEGYQVNSQGQCLDCSEGHEKISESPLECIPRVDKCSEYGKVEDTWRCTHCKPQYKLSSSGRCDDCQKDI